MLVGNKNVNIRELRNACSSPTALEQFAVSLVPEQVRHVRAIVNNQKYYVATMVRDFKSLPYARKQALCSSLLYGVTVCGVCNELFDYNDLLSAVDITLWEKLEEAENAKRRD